jgi:hypothetical protein
MGGLPESAMIEERFCELFRAARLLLREGVTEEERIVPTLAFANDIRLMWSLAAEKERLAAAWDDTGDWERAVEMFAWQHASIRPVEVSDGVLVLERLPVYVYVHDPVYVCDWDAEPNAGTQTRMLEDRDVVIAVYRHSRLPGPEGVAALYEATLSAIRVPYEESCETCAGSMRVEYREDHLLIIVEHGDKTLPTRSRGAVRRKPVYPHPQRVGEHYGLLMGKPSGSGFASRLAARKRGHPPEPVNLIPACVTYHLRTCIESRIEIHRILNEHVLCETWKELPEDDCSSSQTNQLWRDVHKVEDRLLAASHPLHCDEPAWMLTHNTFSPRKLF